MSESIIREMRFPQSRERVWRALTTREALADWLYPNDFVPRPGHRFTFRVPAKPEVKFEGMAVHCEVLEFDPPTRLSFSWSAGPITDTRVSFRLEPDGNGTRLLFEHAGFDLTQPRGEQAFRGAGFGWAKMFEQLGVVVAEMRDDEQ